MYDGRRGCPSPFMATRHGVFTDYLLEGLWGKADLDGDGVIMVDELYTYVSKKVPEVIGPLCFTRENE